MKEETILKRLKSCIIENLKHPQDEEEYKIEDIKVGDIFRSVDCDEDGYYDNYFTIVRHNEKLYLIECNENGKLDSDIDFNDYNSLDEYSNKNQLLYYIKDLDLIPMSL